MLAHMKKTMNTNVVPSYSPYLSINRDYNMLLQSAVANTPRRSNSPDQLFIEGSRKVQQSYVKPTTSTGVSRK